MIGHAIGRRARNALIGTAVGILGLLPLRWLTPRIKLGARVWLWRTLALFVARGRGMGPPDPSPTPRPKRNGPCDVLLVSDALYPERGGGTRSLLSFARGLLAQGQRIACICQGPQAKQFDLGGIEFHWLNSIDEIAECIRSLAPRRMMVQQAWAPFAAKIARENSIPYWYFARSTREFLQNKAIAITADELGRAIRAAADGDPVTRSAIELIAVAEKVVANSRFMAEVIWRGFGRTATIIYPAIASPLPWERERSALSQCIVAIASTNTKGAGIVLELAKAFPEETFLLCGFKKLTPFLQSRIDKKVVRNLVPMGHLPTPAVYALAKIVLVPSQWPEPYGRVVAEAASRHIPMLASRTGGIPEAFSGESHLITEFTSTSAWIDRLGQLIAELADKRLNQATSSTVL